MLLHINSLHSNGQLLDWQSSNGPEKVSDGIRAKQKGLHRLWLTTHCISAVCIYFCGIQ